LIWAERATSWLVGFVIQRFCRLLLWLDKFRRSHPRWVDVGVIAIVSLPAYLLWARVIRAGLLPANVDHVLYQIFHFLFSLATAFVAAVVLKATLPWILYLPYAAEMRALGLLRISTEEGAVLRLVEHHLRLHNKDEIIRVICISGRRLIREPRPPAEIAPLFDAAVKGGLDVVIPLADAHNPTIGSRYDTYSVQYRDGVYPTLNTLVEEVAASRDFLMRHNNVVTQHDALCTWRMVVFSHACIVQNYFPNRMGRDSDTAPVFVFEKNDSANSYYETFTTMFNLIKRYPRGKESVISSEGKSSTTSG
jgi:hypothetical protein